MSMADERNRAMATAKTDFALALRLAENISDAWYRCKSLAAVARFAPESEVVRIADKALSSAKLAGDAYRRVAVSAWVVCALAERGKVDQAQKVVRSLMEESKQIEHPISKGDALLLVWQAAGRLSQSVKQPLLDALLASCLVANGWKSGRTMREVALIVATEDPLQAQRIIDSMREGIYRRQAQRKFDAGQFETVRIFFDQS
ncbi:MAG: hypothetical protein H7308_19745 [Chthonomonadaceae bacterium]|nr:hypothetical protein [Chthonomonadaceae bacterium]